MRNLKQLPHLKIITTCAGAVTVTIHSQIDTSKNGWAPRCRDCGVYRDFCHFQKGHGTRAEVDKHQKTNLR